MTRVRIIGAGLSGLIAGCVFPEASIEERKGEAPENHHSVLRFRSNIVSVITQVPFKEVSVIRCSAPWRNAAADALAYSFKATGVYRSDRSITDLSPQPVRRWIAPEGFASLLAKKMPNEMHFGKEFSPYDGFDGATISTIPMPDLMRILKYDYSAGTWITKRSVNIIAKLPEHVEAYATVYVPDPGETLIRANLTGRTLIAESSSVPHDDEEAVQTAVQALHHLGLPALLVTARRVRVEVQERAKITEVDETVRRRFIEWAQSRHNIYCLGRHAEWVPGLLLDTVANSAKGLRSLLANYY